MKLRIRLAARLYETLGLALLCVVAAAACSMPWWLPDTIAQLGLAGQASRDDAVAQVHAPRRPLTAVPLDHLPE